MYKKFLSILAAVSIFFGGIQGAFAAQAAENATSDVMSETEQLEAKGFGYEHKIKSVEPIKLVDFEKYHLGNGSESGLDKMEGNLFPQKSFEGSGTCIKTDGMAELYVVPNQPIKSGRYLISFDANQNFDSGSNTYLRYNVNVAGATLWESWAIRNKKTGHMSGWNIAKGTAYTADTWIHVAMFVDFDKDTVDYYIDNQYLESASGVPDLHALAFINEGNSGEQRSFDNIAIFEFGNNLRKELKELGIEMPENYATDTELTLSSEYSGNIFTNFDDVDINLEIKSHMENDTEVDMEYRAENYSGETVWTGDEKNVSLKSGETINLNIKPKVDKYDIYTLYVKAKFHDEEMADVETDREFSVVNAPTPGYRSDRYGSCIHISKAKTKWDKIKYSVDTMGLGYLRDDFTWNSYEPENGRYGLTGERAKNMNQLVNDCAEMGIEIVAIWWPDNPRYGVTARIPRTQESLEAMERACAHLAAEYKGKINIFEFTNETNMGRQDYLSCKEYATALQYFYRGIKSGNPDAVVLAGGCSRAAGYWLAKVMAEGGKGYCDAVSVHPYIEAEAPESKHWDVYCGEIRTALEEVGCGELPVWTTEGNVTSSIQYATEQQQGVHLIRQFAQCDAYNVQDKFLWYQMQTSDDNQSDVEACFGILRGPEVKNAYGAKAAYLAATNYFALTEDAEFKDDIQQDNIWLLRYKKADGSNMIMMYSDRSEESVSLNLGAKSGTLYDINGNPQEISSSDGTYSFVLSDEPAYFVYKGDNFELCEDKYEIKTVSYKLPKGSTGVYEFKAPENANISVSVPECLSSEVVRNGENVTLNVTVNELPEKNDYYMRRQSMGTDFRRDKIEVTVHQGDKETIYLPFIVDYLKYSAEIDFTLLPYDSSNLNHWKGRLQVQNHRTPEDLNGVIVLESPQKLAESLDPIKVENLHSEAEGTYTFNIPSELTKGDNQLFAGKLITDDGEEIPFSVGDTTYSFGYRKNTGTNLKYLKKSKQAPVIDGVVDKEEWENYLITNFDKSQVSFGSTNTVIAGVVEQKTFGAEADYGDKSDFSGSIFAQWDNDYLYLAAVVYDDVHYQKEDPVRFYLDDFFYIDVCPTKTQRHDTRLELALTEFFGDNKGRLYRNWSQMDNVVIGGVIPDSEDGAQTCVVRKDNATIYEGRIPWTDIVSEETFKGKNFNLSFGIRDYDGDRDKTFNYGGWYCLVNQ